MGLRGFPGVQGGVEKHCEALYPRMEGLRFRVYRRKSYVRNNSTSPWPNITFTDLPSTRISGFEAAFQTFLAALHAAMVSRPRIVHVHNIGPGFVIPILRLFGLKTILTYHSSNYEHTKWSRPARALLRAAEWVSMRCAHRVIFVNRRQYERLSPRYPDKCVFMPNGVDAPTPDYDTALLNELGVTTGSYILAVGRITPEKGFDHLVRAVNLLDRDCRLVIAGGSDHDRAYLSSLKALDIHGRVIFAGNRQGRELAQLYTHARLFVLSSVNEGFPLVLLEAMSYGLHVIASDIPATHLPQLDGIRKFPPANPEALAKELTDFLAPIPRLARMDYDLSDYDWTKIAAEVAHQYTLCK